MGQYILGLLSGIRAGKLLLGLIFAMRSIDHCLSWIEDNLLLYLLYFMTLTMHTRKYAYQLIGMMPTSKQQTSTAEL